MKDQHKHIKGYRELTQTEIDLMNEVKGFGVKLGHIIVKLEEHKLTDKRWVKIAKTDLQKGLMAAVRSVARPETF